MHTRGTLGIRIVGWMCIIFSFAFLVYIPTGAAVHRTLAGVLTEAGGHSVQPSLMLGNIVMFGLLFLTGTGLLRHARWAYYAALCIPVIGFFNIMWEIWFFGGQYYQPTEIAVLMGLYVFALAIMASARVRLLFTAKGVFTAGQSLPVVLRTLLICIMAGHVLSIPFWLVYGDIRYGKYPYFIKGKPVVSHYQVDDSDGAAQHYVMRDIFKYRMALPRDAQINVIYKSKEFGWDMVLSNGEEAGAGYTFFLNSGGLQYLQPLARVLKFDSLYAFEKKVQYPTRSPLYLALKQAMGLRTRYVEEVYAVGWKGFIKSTRGSVQPQQSVECSLYSLDEHLTGGVSIHYQAGSLDTQEIKNILATLDFTHADMPASVFFQHGMQAFEAADYVSAAFNFMAALSRDSLQSEYAYWLAYSLYQNPALSARRMRLSSSRGLLLYALHYNTQDTKAQELLALVEEQLRRQG